MNTPHAGRRPRLALATRLGIGIAAIAVVLLAGNWAAQRNTRYALERLHDTEVARMPIALAADTLTDRVLAFDRAILDQLREDSARTRGASERASQRLDAAIDSYALLTSRPAGTREDVARIGSDGADEFAGEVREHLRLGAELASTAASRQRLITEYRHALESLSDRVSSSFDASADLAGGVSARRSHADLELALGRLRDAFSGYLVSPTPSARRELESAQEAFRRTQQLNHAELARSAGQGWMDLVDEDIGTAIAKQRRIAAVDREVDALRTRFTDSGVLLPATLESRVAVPARVAIADSANEAANATRSTERAFRWIALAVLVIALIVSAFTMFSVTRPVRRLTEASRALARGAWNTRVPLGGPREIESLATAFNNMAQQLASMHAALAGHRAELEDRVRARTRKLHHLAHHDALTNLPNRRYGFTQLRRLVRDAKDGSHVALLALDVDNFKVINDNLGHTLGDELLCAIAQRLLEAAGPDHFVARLAGDEFLVLMHRITSPEEAEQIGARIVDAFRQPLHVDSRDILIGISAGVAVYPQQAGDAQSLARAADAALFQAKAQGRNRVATFMPDLLRRSEARFGLEQALRRAIEHRELALVYQPQVNLATGETTSLEALVRWQRADGSYVPPNDLIAVAEQSGLIIPLGDWVLEAATRTVAGWRSGGFTSARVAINVSTHQLLDNGFIDRVAAALERHQLPASAIELELTESAFQTGTATIDALRQAQALGIEFALDDFGTGYSSLTSLLKLPVRRVKLDRSLITEVGSSPRSAAVARSIMTVCQSLGLEVTVEGIEEFEQLGFIARRAGVAAQGYLIARPLPADSICVFARTSEQRLGALYATEAPSPAVADSPGAARPLQVAV